MVLLGIDIGFESSRVRVGQVCICLTFQMTSVTGQSGPSQLECLDQLGSIDMGFSCSVQIVWFSSRSPSD